MTTHTNLVFERPRLMRDFKVAMHLPEFFGGHFSYAKILQVSCEIAPWRQSSYVRRIGQLSVKELEDFVHVAITMPQHWDLAVQPGFPHGRDLDHLLIEDCIRCLEDVTVLCEYTCLDRHRIFCPWIWRDRPLWSHLERGFPSWRAVRTCEVLLKYRQKINLLAYPLMRGPGWM